MSEDKTPTLSSRIIKLIHDDNGVSDVETELFFVIRNLDSSNRRRLFQIIQDRSIEGFDL